MPLPPDFPESPHEILAPDARWSPDDADMFWGKLPPLVEKLRAAVKAWRDEGYPDVSPTAAALLDWWFGAARLQSDLIHDSFRYYFAQREAIETVIYLYEVKRVKDKHDLMRFDSTGALSAGMFDEDWLRFVVKMATGSGKTKVLSLALAWCYFHKRYEADSKLARNFLIIAPNIIVLDRLRKDFDGLRIFYEDPVLPENGHAGRNWRDDFQLTVHLQDEVRAAHATGNIFLTNIHRVYAGKETSLSADDEDASDYFLGKKPTGATTDSKVDLGEIVRDIDELAVFNDEAHHIHDPNMAWFKSIEDIHNRLKQKGGGLALQVDTTATPRHNDGAIFAQTVTDYPLVEAIAQNIVKHPVIPDSESRAKLKEEPSAKFSERYADYLHLGVDEWKKAVAQNDKLGKKSILFVMTDDTKNCDEVAAYLENTCPELKGAVLVIHTKKNGEISEAADARAKKELDRLREQANNIDHDARYKAIVSVLMLKEGWDVRNVTTIVGLRAYSAKSNILPEQTLGRGLRLMFGDDRIAEELSVVGTDAFMEFVESIKKEGVVLKQKRMGDAGAPQPWVVVEVDRENPNKDIDALDIAFPALTPRNYRDFGRLEALDTKAFQHEKMPYQQFDDEAMRTLTFVYIVTDKESHRMKMPPSGVSDYRQVVKFYTDSIIRSLRLVSAHDVLYGKVKSFIRDGLFGHPVDLEDRNTLRNLSRTEVTKQVVEVFKKEINALTVRDKGGAGIDSWIKVSEMRPFRATRRKETLIPQKSALNKIIGDSGLEITFAQFLESCADVVSYAKNYPAVGFRMDYVKANGDISNYTPDFLVKTSESEVYVVETKGQVDEDVPHKMERLKQWCADVNRAQAAVMFDFVYVDEESFAAYKPRDFAALVAAFRRYKER